MYTYIDGGCKYVMYAKSKREAKHQQNGWVFNSLHATFIVIHPYLIAVYELMVSKFEGIKFPALKLRDDN